MEPTEPIDPLAIERLHNDNALAYRRGYAPEAKVPCGDCRACCYHPDVEVDPLHDNAAILKTERKPNGMLVLRRRDDGSCIHLGPTGCEVYADRPRTCRAYDCRYWALLNVTLEYADGHQKGPVWTFKRDTVAQRTSLQAYTILAFMVDCKVRERGHAKPTEDVDIAHFARLHIEECRARVRAIGGVTLDEIATMTEVFQGKREFTAKEKKINALMCHFDDQAEIWVTQRRPAR